MLDELLLLLLFGLLAFVRRELLEDEAEDFVFVFDFVAFTSNLAMLSSESFFSGSPKIFFRKDSSQRPGLFRNT